MLRQVLEIHTGMNGVLGYFKAVEMLNPNSGIESVAFQKAGIKGWDDVVVKF